MDRQIPHVRNGGTMTSEPGEGTIRRRLMVAGIVQGVGYRPFVWREATVRGLRGWVGNESGGVRIEVEGPAEAVAAFERSLWNGAPALARVERIDAVTVPRDPWPRSPSGFAILDSLRGPGSTGVPADVAICAACLAEVRDPSDRRHLHPFANCTDCGPRYGVILGLPYDRAATTLARHARCAACLREYADPADRRFHAQPISCPDCGPVAWYAAPGDARAEPVGRPPIRATLDAARALLRAGGILAVRGLGGFHLACDATSAAAVAALRARKRRPTKPLAVMVADAARCAPFARLSSAERRVLESPERPVVLLARRGDGAPLAAGVAPGVGEVGVMLPGFALHAMLLDADADGRPMPALVMTSGNLAGDPMEHDNAAAIARLGALADGFLLHDRDIHLPCDDSVVRVAPGGIAPIRRSRGAAPLPVPLTADGPDLLAVGADQKVSIGVARGRQAWLSQHLGDLGTPESLDALERTARHLLDLLGVRPAAVVADLHPGYLSVACAGRLAAALGVPLVRAAHHEAHAAALLADRRAARAGGTGRPLLVAAFDGSGYRTGDDGPIVAGGEFFRVEDGADGVPGIAGPERFRHVAALHPFALPGGEAAILHPWRTALALLHAAGIPWDDRLPAVRAAGRSAALLRRQLDRGLACTPTTSVGRLFDGVAALLGARLSISHEGEAAMALEHLAAGTAPARAYAPAPLLDRGGIVRIDWRGPLATIVDDILAGVDRAAIAAGFHRLLADAIAAVAAKVGAGAGPLEVGLTGGVFQNARLVAEASAALAADGHTAFGHGIVPPNDGGIALGQLVLGRAALVTSPARVS